MGSPSSLDLACAWGLLGLLAACGKEDTLTVDASESDAVETATSEQEPDAAPANGDEPSADAGRATDILPGQRFEFTLGERVYLDLSIPAVVAPSSNDTFTWDLLFEGLTLYTNSGAAGPGFGASYGPSSEFDLLFDSAPAVPLRADMSESALLNWYWFGPNGITSRYHTYGLRDGDGRLFKLQVLSYYDDSDAGHESAVYTLRYAEVSAGNSGETSETSGINANAGGVTLPPSSPAGCIDLATGKYLQLAQAQWGAMTDWDLCFQRTEVFLNGGLTGSGAVQAVDLDIDSLAGADSGVTEAEKQQTAEGALERFDAIDYAALTQPNLPWEQEYQARPRIGTRWLTGEHDNPGLTMGSWIIRGADGESHYALYFTDIARTADQSQTVGVQVKPLSPPTTLE